MTSPSISHVFFACLIAMAVAGCPAGAFETETIDGVIHIRNESQPRDGLQHLHLQEQWRRGGDNDDIFFGMVTRVREDEDGNLYVMDAQLSEVHVYDPKGYHLRTLFGEGDGPGEVRGPRDLVLMDDGRVGVVQEVPGKLIFVDRLGDPAGTLGIGGPGVQHGGFCQTFAAFNGGDVLLVAGFVQTPGATQGQLTQTSFLTRFDAQGQPAALICETVNELDLAGFTFVEHKHLSAFWWNAAVGPDGLIYAAPHLGRYEIQVHDGEGRLQRVISRDYQPRRRTAKEREDFSEAIRAIYSGLPFEVGVELADHDPAILNIHRGLRVAPDGSLWILTPQGIHDQPDGIMAAFDIFSPEGEYVRQVAIHAPFDGRKDGLFFFGDHAVVVTGFVEAMMAQFTGGNMSVDVADDEAGIEVIRCGVVD